MALRSSRGVGGGGQLWQAKLARKDRTLASSRKALLADVLAHGDKLAGTLSYREAHCCNRETLRLDSKPPPFPRGSSDTGEGIWPIACFLVVSSGHWPESHGDWRVCLELSIHSALVASQWYEAGAGKS